MASKGERHTPEMRRIKQSKRPASKRGCLLVRQVEKWRADLLCCLPFGQLAQTLLASPHAGVDDLEEELAGPGVEDEDGTIDGFGGEVTLKGLVDGYPVHIGVIHKPDDLVTEQLTIVLHMQCRVWHRE